MYSHHFITLHLILFIYYMDYFNNVFTTFLGLESCNDVVVYGGINQSILICVLEMNVLWV